LSIISNITLVIVFLLSLIICNALKAEEHCKNDVCIEFNDIQLKISSEYILIPAFKEYPKYMKYVDQLLVSSLYLKDKRLCLDYCEESFRGKVFSDGVSSKKLIIVHGEGYSASSWSMEFTNFEGPRITHMGIIYTNNTLLQVFDDKKLWLYLLSQLNSKS
jgi:hypothetical protein